MLSCIQHSGIRLLDRPLETLMIEMEMKVWVRISALTYKFFCFSIYYVNMQGKYVYNMYMQGIYVNIQDIYVNMLDKNKKN